MSKDRVQTIRLPMPRVGPAPGPGWDPGHPGGPAPARRPPEHLDDALLKGVGLTRVRVEQEAAEPLWRL